MVSVRRFQYTGGGTCDTIIIGTDNICVACSNTQAGTCDTIITGTDNIRRRVNGEIANEAFGAI